MNLKIITEKLMEHDLDGLKFIKEVVYQVIDEIRDGELKIIDLVQVLDPVLTNGSHDIRLRGVEILTQVIMSLENNLLSEKEIEVLTEFLFFRLIDHKTMEQPTLRCLSYFIDCKNKPLRFNKNSIEFLKTKINVQKMDNKGRSLVYEIMNKVIMEKRRISDTIDSDLIYSLIHMIEGESSPDNLMLCFGMVSYVLKSFQDLEPYIDDIFDWLSSYYPIDYTPSDKDSSEGVNILRSDLVQALYDCFYVNPLNSENLQTLLLEKLESNIMSSKLESLHCLIKCYAAFPLASIKDYTSSLWTAIRMECLKKQSLIDSRLLEHSLKALSALTKKLSEDNDLYFSFISDLYEELSIAFRKPEMDLFEPATRLITSAVQPKLIGFNYILNKMLPISINAISVDELRPMSGLAYIFEQLLLNHPESKLNLDFNDSLNRLALCISTFVATHEDSLRLLNAMIRYKVDLEVDTLDTIIKILLYEVNKSSLDLKECLALICANYERSDILFDDTKKDCQISSLIKLVFFYNRDKMVTTEDTSSTHLMLTKFSIYLRQLTLILNASQSFVLNDLNQQDLNRFLIETRNAAVDLKKNHELVENIGLIHAIVINKLDNENVNPILMDIFSSNFCQNLVPNNDDGRIFSCHVYLPILRWILKSLVVRNHKLAAPLINLLLNYITSNKVDENLALSGSQIFSFIHSDNTSYQFNKKQHYNVFALYKQKFYSQTRKEIKIRYNSLEDFSKKNVLICTLAIQITHIPLAVYKEDYEWLLRELLKILSTLKNQIGDPEKCLNEELISVSYETIQNLILKDNSDNLSGLLNSLVELNLVYAKEAKTLNVRKRALACLTIIATSFNDSELLILRSSVVDKLKPCLADKKRVVRQAAAEARLRWVLVGQPVGSQ